LLKCVIIAQIAASLTKHSRMY